MEFPEEKERICEIGRRLYQKGFAAANEGNLSVRVGEDLVLCTPTLICKGFMKPDDICTVNLSGEQVAGKRKKTSEVLLHLEIYRRREDVKSVVHCHPPHATAFGVAREPIPTCVLPEPDIFLGEVPIAPYETPGNKNFAETISPFVEKTNTIILANHGTVSYETEIERAYWLTEILDAYCRILILSKQLGGARHLDSDKGRELLELRVKWGFDDARLNSPEGGRGGHSAFQDHWKIADLAHRAFPPHPSNAQADSKRESTQEMDWLVEAIAARLAEKLGQH